MAKYLAFVQKDFWQNLEQNPIFLRCIKYWKHDFGLDDLPTFSAAPRFYRMGSVIMIKC